MKHTKHHTLENGWHAWTCTCGRVWSAKEQRDLERLWANHLPKKED